MGATGNGWERPNFGRVSEKKDFRFHTGGKQLKDGEVLWSKDDNTGYNQVEENIQKEIIVGLR